MAWHGTGAVRRWTEALWMRWRAQWPVRLDATDRLVEADPLAAAIPASHLSQSTRPPPSLFTLSTGAAAIRRENQWSRLAAASAKAETAAAEDALPVSWELATITIERASQPGQAASYIAMTSDCSGPFTSHQDRREGRSNESSAAAPGHRGSSGHQA